METFLEFVKKEGILLILPISTFIAIIMLLTYFLVHISADKIRSAILHDRKRRGDVKRRYRRLQKFKKAKEKKHGIVPLFIRIAHFGKKKNHN